MNDFAAEWKGDPLAGLAGYAKELLAVCAAIRPEVERMEAEIVALRRRAGLGRATASPSFAQLTAQSREMEASLKASLPELVLDFLDSRGCSKGHPDVSPNGCGEVLIKVTVDRPVQADAFVLLADRAVKLAANWQVVPGSHVRVKVFAHKQSP